MGVTLGRFTDLRDVTRKIIFKTAMLFHVTVVINTQVID